MVTKLQKGEHVDIDWGRVALITLPGKIAMEDADDEEVRWSCS
jgi:hypothetical protein